MKKCLHCQEICEDSVTICPKCGAMVDTYVDHKEYMNVYHINHGKRIKSRRIVLWFLLGLILPYIGFIVSWIMFDGEREKAKAVLIGAIVSTLITSFLPYILIMFGNGSNEGGNGENKGQQIKLLMEMYRNL